MKLLFVHQNFGEYGGAETYVALAAQGLAEAGHEVALAYSEKTGRNEARWQEIFREAYLLDDTRDGQQVREILEKFRPDLLFIHNWTNLDALEELLSSEIPCVRMVHDHAIYCLRTYKYNYFTRKICTRAASGFCVFPCLANLQRDRGHALGLRWGSYSNTVREIRLNQRCTALLVYSEYQKAELIRNGFAPEKIFPSQLLRPGNPEELASNFSDENIVLFVGQVIRGKGVDALLKALAQVTVPFRCVIVGDGNHRPACERLRDKLGLRDRVSFEGYVPPADLQRFYLSASVFAMSSLWPEPFGMAGPEAMRYALPVVAFDAGAISEWLQHRENGLLVPWNDTRSYARALDTLLRDKSLARAMGARARESVRKFEPSRQLALLENTLRQLCRTPAFRAPRMTTATRLCV